MDKKRAMPVVLILLLLLLLMTATIRIIITLAFIFGIIIIGTLISNRETMPKGYNSGEYGGGWRGSGGLRGFGGGGF